MRRKLTALIGVCALVLLGILMMRAIRMDRVGYREQAALSGEMIATAAQSLAFQREELVYDGRGELDLMEGVTATDVDGSDITEQVNAVITGRSGVSRKTVRYSVFLSDGRELTALRSLVMQGYRGPQLSVEESLDLAPEDLTDLAQVLKDRGALEADDGFGRDAAGQVTWQREKISTGIYNLTFSLVNPYLDSASAEAEAHIAGAMEDIRLTLTQNQAEIPMGAALDPLLFVAQAGSTEEENDLLDRVQVESYVNPQIPGIYSVIYTLTSLDNTQIAREVLTVTVTGGEE